MLRSFANCCSRSHACACRSPPPPAADGKSRVARCPPAAVGEQAGSTSQTSAARSRPLAEGCFSRWLVADPSARLRAETESCVALQRGGPQLRPAKARMWRPFASCCPCEDRTKAGVPCGSVANLAAVARCRRRTCRSTSQRPESILSATRFPTDRRTLPRRKKRGPLQERAAFRCVFATVVPTPCRRTPSDIP